MKLSSSQQRRLDAEVLALELSGLDPQSARAKAEGDAQKRVTTNKKRALWRRQRQQIASDLGLVRVVGPVSGRSYWE